MKFLRNNQQPQHSIFEEDKYLLKLGEYLVKNPNKSEFDFLTDHIRILEKDIKDRTKSGDIKERDNWSFKYHTGAWIGDQRTDDWVEIFDYQNYYDKKSIINLQSIMLEYKIRLDRLPKPVKEEAIDWSDTNRSEKIIMLHELGVLEFLKQKEPFNTSTNQLASVISGITGVKATTVQSYINPIVNPDRGLSQNNNPLTRKDLVNKIIKKLSSIGFKKTQ